MSALLCVLSPTLGRIKNLTPEISPQTKAKAELTNQILFLLQTARRKCLSLVFLAPPQFLCQAYFQPLSNLFCALQPKWMVAGEVLWEGGAGQSCLSVLQFKHYLYLHLSLSLTIQTKSLHSLFFLLQISSLQPWRGGNRRGLPAQGADHFTYLLDP